jgi:PIN domain nuclease of toxin-antitoxin system
VKYLLDTHVLLWWLDNKSPLKPAVRQCIDDPHHDISISSASIWEIGIKKALGQLTAPEDLLEILDKNRMTVLPITAQHAYAVRSLPRLHGDPFDRMLVTQAMLEGFTVMTHDKHMAAYSISCMMV